MGNLNTHSTASLYATFEPSYAFALEQRLDIAEIELSSLGRQCISNNRIPDLQSLRKLLEPWCVDRNRKPKGVDWQFSFEEARIKLKHLYPIIIF